MGVLPPFLDAATLTGPVPRWEYHLHSRFSDGVEEVANLVAQAVDKGLARLVFTEHTEASMHAGDPDWFARYVETIERERQVWAGRIEIGLGLEVPLLDYDGTLEVTGEMLARADFILGAVHAYPGRGWQPGASEEAVDLEWRALMVLAAHPAVHAIAHPGGICHRYHAPFPMELFERVVREAVIHGKAIEMNPAYQDPLGPYFEICRRHGARITPGSNAHRAQEMGLAHAKLSELFRISIKGPAMG